MRAQQPRRRFLRYRTTFAAIVFCGGVASGTVLAGPGSGAPRPTNQTSATGVDSCSSKTLSVHYWTTMPAMTQGMSGLNVTNVGTSACQLPTFPSAIGVTDSGGVAVPAATMQNATGTGQTAVDFVNYGSASAPISANSAMPVPGGPIVLEPGETGVLLISTFLPVSNLNGQYGCLTAPTGGQLALSLDASDTLDAPIPATPVLISQIDADGSAFSTCATAVVFPFVTWQTAQSLVGPPTPVSAATGVLRYADQSIYSSAP